jgi:hypothetical protein
MKCEYTFKVQGFLHLDQSHPIPLNGRDYLFGLDKTTKRVQSLVVVVPANDRNFWPTITELAPKANDPNAPKAHVNLRSPELEEIVEDAQAIEAVLALQGIGKIDVDEISIRFIPENEGERSLPDIQSFSMGYGSAPTPENEVNTFDVIARSVLAVPELQHVRTAMSFFRKGGNDIRGRQYIDAFYDFFFVIETMFADGKSRTHAMKEAFAQNSLLLACTRAATAEALRDAKHAGEPKALRRFEDLYVRTDPIETLASLIETRGFLHHHAVKRPGTWDPNRESAYKLDAFLLQNLAFKVLWSTIVQPVFCDAAVKRYQSIYADLVKP